MGHANMWIYLKNNVLLGRGDYVYLTVSTYNINSKKEKFKTYMSHLKQQIKLPETSSL